MITSEQANAIAKSVSGKTNIDLTSWKLKEGKQVEDIIRAEASQGEVRVRMVIESRYSKKIIGRLLQCHFYAVEESVGVYSGVVISTLLVSWAFPRVWPEDVVQRYLKD